MNENNKRQRSDVFIVPKKSRFVSESLECKICVNYFKTPIRACHNGHTICSPCWETMKKDKKTNCAECRDPEGYRTRCRSLEIMLESVAIDCQYACGLSWTLDQIHGHQAICDQRPVECNLGCGTSVMWSNLKFHLKDIHGMEETEKGKFMEFGILPYGSSSQLRSRKLFLLELGGDYFVIFQDIHSFGLSFYVKSLKHRETPTFAEIHVKSPSNKCKSIHITEVGCIREGASFKNKALIAGDTVRSWCEPAAEQKWNVRVDIVEDD